MLLLQIDSMVRDNINVEDMTQKLIRDFHNLVGKNEEVREKVERKYGSEGEYELFFAGVTLYLLDPLRTYPYYKIRLVVLRNANDNFYTTYYEQEYNMNHEMTGESVNL